MGNRDSFERRRHQRYDLMVQVYVRQGSMTYIMEVHNISLSGIFIAAEDVRQIPRFRLGQDVELDIFEIQELENIKLSGAIVRIVEDADKKQSGFGVQFANLDKETEEKLKRLIELAAERSIRPPPLPDPKGPKD